MARAALHYRLVPMLLAATLAGCGREAAPTAAEPWPLALQAPGIVAYAAVRLPASERDALFTRLFGFAPEGLDDGRALVALVLDAMAYGGEYALLLPARDAEASLQSLEHQPRLRAVGDGEYVMEVPPESGLGELMLLTSGLRGTRSLADVFAALRDLGPQSLTFHAAVANDWVLVAPTFESSSACRAVLRETGGFAASPPHAAVLSIDCARGNTVYAEALASLESQLRGMIGGAQTAGLIGVAARAAHDGDSDRPPIDLGVNWEVLWALKDMLGLQHVQAVQLQLESFGPDDPAQGDTDLQELGNLFARFAAVPGATLRARVAPGSPQAAVLDALRPAPELRDAPLVLAADGPSFARAVAQWVRPLAEVVKGKGPPCDRYLDELASILSAAGGCFALQRIEDEWCLLASAGEAQPDALPRLGAWLAPLLAAARVEGATGEVSVRDASDGRTLLLDAGGAVQASVGRRGGVLWLRAGDAPAPEAACVAFERALAGPPPAGAPALRLRAEWIAADVRVADGELALELRRVDDGR